LRVGRVTVQLDVLVRRVESARDFGLDALVRGDDDLGRAVELKELSEDQACHSKIRESEGIESGGTLTRGSGTEDKDLIR
jgi:hypothetical protein